jgi:hypothetical protein
MKTIHIQFERRGPKEDSELELEFRRICDNQGNWGYKNLILVKPILSLNLLIKNLILQVYSERI